MRSLVVGGLIASVAFIGCARRENTLVDPCEATGLPVGPALHTEPPQHLTEADDGKVYCYPVGAGSEFGFDLDPSRHPRKDLNLGACEGNVQTLMRHDPNGPDAYPAGFLVNVSDLECEITNGDYSVRLVFPLDTNNSAAHRLIRSAHFKWSS